MTSLDTSKNSEIDTLKAGWEKKKESDLQQEMGLYFAKGDYAKGDALRNYIKEKFHPEELKDRSTEFEDSYKRMNDKIDEIKADYEKKREGMTPETEAYINLQREEQEKINEKMREFFSDDMDKYVTATKEGENAIIQSKDQQIAELQKQLHDVVVEGPKFKEYFNLQRNRLVTINNRIENFKEKHRDNYPKNVLVYLMALVEHRITGGGQLIKRGWITMRRGQKTDHMVDNLKILEQKLQPQPGDSLWTKALKDQVKQHLNDAKEAYMNQQRKSVYG